MHTAGTTLCSRSAIYGDVKVSTGILKSEERAAAGTALKAQLLKLNANDNLAYAA